MAHAAEMRFRTPRKAFNMSQGYERSLSDVFADTAREFPQEDPFHL